MDHAPSIARGDAFRAAARIAAAEAGRRQRLDRAVAEMARQGVDPVILSMARGFAVATADATAGDLVDFLDDMAAANDILLSAAGQP